MNTLDALLARGAAAVQAGDRCTARRLLTQAVRQDPGSETAWLWLSAALQTPQGRAFCLRRVLALNPHHPAARRGLAAVESAPRARALVAQPLPLPPPSRPAPSRHRFLRRLRSRAPSTAGPRIRTLSSLAGYLLRRSLAILLTIIVGVYLTVLIANKSGALDQGVKRQIQDQIKWLERHDYFVDVRRHQLDGAKNKLQWRLEQELGLWLPSGLRHLRWTYNALTFQWGETVFRPEEPPPGHAHGIYQVNKIILLHFPNTLLVIGAANLIIFLFGIPFALFLAARKQGRWLDRFVSMLSPISSVPSWVHGILLISLFAIQLKLLPHGGRYDILPADTWLDDVAVAVKHMILPVLAVLLGMFFQLVYAWRTFLAIYAEEDYVELARAKGLVPATVERRYILRPSLPYLLTSFALTLVGFWQMTTALEYVFHWPGIGQLYLSALPYYYDDSFYPGEMTIVISLVVIFAYLLGLTVLLLDLVYAWVDPRIRLTSHGYTLSPSTRRSFWSKLFRRTRRRRAGRSPPRFPSLVADTPRRRRRISISGWWRGLKGAGVGLARMLRGLLRYPAAVVGLAIITLMVIGSICAVVALPYMEIGEEWHGADLTGRVSVPKNVPAVWTNWFRRHDLPTTVVRTTQDGTIDKTIETLDSGMYNIRFTTDFEYPQSGFPQDVFLHISSSYQRKRPHVSITWTTPDGREIKPESPAIASEDTYAFSDYIPVGRYLMQNEHWQKWFERDKPSPTPAFYVLFADPEAEQAIAVPGTYRLDVTAMAFEENTDVDIEFILMGRVYGWAGTDYLRRDLLVPLLWGLPFALAFGLVGATLTTVLAMILAAAGAWLGGWVDGLVQRLTEVNLILPVLAVGVLYYTLYDVSLWAILTVVITLNVFSSPTKTFRAAFLQAKEAAYIESARAYGASDARIILRYLMPRVVPTLIPQIVTLIPSMVFLEATLGILGIYDPRFPSWGKVIREALLQNALWGGSAYWVLEPIGLLLLTGLAFALLGFGLERVLNPRLQAR